MIEIESLEQLQALCKAYGATVDFIKGPSILYNEDMNEQHLDCL